MYLDPGFGSMLIQVAIAAFAAMAVVIGVFRAKVIAFFKKGKVSPDEGAGEDGENDESVYDEAASEEDVNEEGANSEGASDE